MFEKCIKCTKIGESCVPNLMLLPFADLIQWCNQRQKYLGYTNKELAEKSKVPEGTIGRIKGGDYMDCRYSTIKSVVIALIGGTTDEFSCTAQVEKELKQLEQLEHLARTLSSVEKENETLKLLLAEYREMNALLKEAYNRNAKIIDIFAERKEHI
jgi:predicted transcriptional regulator